MGVWNKSPKIPPEEHARIQRIISAHPEIQALRDEAGRQSMVAGRSVGWTDIPNQIRRILQREGVQIPEGYDVNMDGELVYTNKTPFLQQAAWGALPIAGVSAIGALAGPGTAAGGGAAGGAAADVAAVDAAIGGMGTGGLATAAGAGAAGEEAARRRRTAGDTAGDLASRFNPWQQAALAALSGVPALMANRGPSDEERGLYDQARQMTQLQRERIESQNPLFQAVTQLAMSRLPTNVQR